MSTTNHNFNLGTIQNLKDHAKDAVRVMELHGCERSVTLLILSCVDLCDAAKREMGDCPDVAEIGQYPIYEQGKVCP